MGNPEKDEITFNIDKGGFTALPDSNLDMIGANGVLAGINIKILNDAKPEEIAKLGTIAAQEISGIGRKAMEELESAGAQGVLGQFARDSSDWYDNHFKPEHLETPPAAAQKNARVAEGAKDEKQDGGSKVGHKSALKEYGDASTVIRNN